MTVNKTIRIIPEQYTRLKALGSNMRPPCTASAIAIEMIRQALVKWEKGYRPKNGK